MAEGGNLPHRDFRELTISHLTLITSDNKGESQMQWRRAYPSLYLEAVVRGSGTQTGANRIKRRGDRPVLQALFKEKCLATTCWPHKNTTPAALSVHSRKRATHILATVKIATSEGMFNNSTIL